MAVDGGGDARVDLVHERVQATGGRIAVRAHVDAAAQPARGPLEDHVFLANHRAPVLAPLLDELLPALLLDVVVRDRGRRLGRHWMFPLYGIAFRTKGLHHRIISFRCAPRISPSCSSSRSSASLPRRKTRTTPCTAIAAPIATRGSSKKRARR